MVHDTEVPAGDVVPLVLAGSPVGVVHLSLVAGYAGFAVWLHARSRFLSVTFGSYSDWTDYRLVARAAPWSTDFWTGVKPGGYPLLVKLLGEGAALHWAAVVLSIVAWSALALAVAMVLRDRGLAVGGLVLMLAVSLSERIQVWSDLAGSESVSISLLVLAIAAGFALVGGRLPSAVAQHRLRVVAWAVLSVALVGWAFTRDSNTYVLLLAATVAACVGVWKRSVVMAVVYAITLVVCGVALVAADAGDRWVVPYDNIVFNRVLTDPELAAAWRDAGMPDPPALRPHIGEIAYHGDPALFRDPRLAAFRRWVNDHGRTTYIEELVTRPSLGVGGPVADLDVLLTSRVEVWGRIGGRSYAGSPVDPVVDSLFVPDAAPLAIWSVLVVAASMFLVVGTRRSCARAASWFVVAVLALGVPHLWLVWVGDAHNVARHAVTASVQIRVAGWLVLLLALDELLARRRRLTTVDA